MKSGTHYSGGINVLLLINRLSLGLYFAFAGIRKINNGVEHFYRGSFSAMKPTWLPELLAKPFGFALPWMEAIFGITLAIGLFGKISAGFVIFMLACIMLAKIMAEKFFGPPAGFDSTTIYLTLAILLAYYGPGAISIDALIGKRKRR